jgi:epoxyqueuosine reductase
MAVASVAEPPDQDFARYEAFVDAGMHGSMGYLADHREVRRSVSTEAILHGARSVICVAQRYAVRCDEGQGVVGRIARYARGRDYHGHLRQRLRKLAELVRGLAPGAEARPLCDTAPVLERAWAARAGLGFVGKNGMLIVPGLGSYVLLGEVVTTLALPPDRPQPQRCGACDSCLRACPTAAFVRPHVLDARRCIGYLTIEQRGPCDPTLEQGVGGRIFGCDACQAVCPHNAAQRAFIDPGTAYDPLPQWLSAALPELLGSSDAALEARLQGSALRRAGVEGIRRNLLIAVGNDGDPAHEAVLRDCERRCEPAWLGATAGRALARLRSRDPR